MQLLIAYSTTEGHSAKVAQFACDMLLCEGHTALICDLDDHASAPALDDAEGVILVGSVHERRHSTGLEVFMQAQRVKLSKLPTLLLSVSLSAAFDQGMEEAQDYVVETEMRTGFSPSDVVLVAGAVKPGSYDYFSQQVLRFVVLKDRGYELGTNDHAFTDWDKIRVRLHRFVDASIAHGKPAA